MGIPAAFRWLSRKYPKIVSPVIEEQPLAMEDGTVIPVDGTRANPNGEEFDNLYLDMNGIVHPCSHPEDRPAPKDEEEMMIEIFKYTERVFNMVRPRKLMMIAVDGVAPRAKMNQQRSRRFKAAQEAKEKEEDKAQLLQLLKKQNGGTLEVETAETITKKAFDSNSITPGTPFMDILAASLRYWCAYKLNSDPAWAKIKVIISDATVPGEGEHKIMNFVRAQRSSPDHDPNTRHVIYGLDADLIMLGLATHEPHFRVLREDVFFQDSKARMCKLCGQKGHDAETCRGEAKEKDGEFDEKDKAHPLKPFIWLHISVLREYLAVELHVPNLPFRFDLERAIDDWVFMCFFVGNDFLPHLPALEIREDGINTLTAIWKDNLPHMGGYVTKDGHVDLERAQYILSGLAKQEDAIFRRRRQMEERRDANAKRRKIEESNGRRGGYQNSPTNNRGRRGPIESGPPPPGLELHPISEFPSGPRSAITHDMVVNRAAINEANLANKSAASVLKTRIQGLASQATGGSEPSGEETTEPITPATALGKRKASDMESSEMGTPGEQATPDVATPSADISETPIDTVKLWEEGYADRYYEQKFHVDPKDIAFRHKVGRAYVEGLAWVLMYYFQGCPSWEWYYPYHYAPFAADFVDLAKMKINFSKGRISRPFEQLMSVLPAASRHAIPEVFHDLMTNEDSEIIDFYPEDFDVDLNGKKFAWQGVVLLPFIDMPRLLGAMEKKYPLLSPEDKARNDIGNDVLLLSDAHPQLYDEITTAFYSKKQTVDKLKLDPRTSDGLAGKVEKVEGYYPHGSLVYPLDRNALPDVEYDRSLSVHYENPNNSHIHKSMLLRGVQLPTPALDQVDIEELKGKASRSGRSYGGVPLNNQGGRNGNGYGRREPINYGPGGQYPRQDRSGRGGYHHSQNGYDAGREAYRPPSNSWQQQQQQPPHPPPPGFPGFGVGLPPPPPPAHFYNNNNNNHNNSNSSSSNRYGGYQGQNQGSAPGQGHGQRYGGSQAAYPPAPGTHQDQHSRGPPGPGGRHNGQYHGDRGQRSFRPYR